MANTMFHPRHGNAEEDEGIAKDSVSFLGAMIQQVPCESLKRTQVSCEELLRQTRMVRQRASENLASGYAV